MAVIQPLSDPASRPGGNGSGPMCPGRVGRQGRLNRQGQWGEGQRIHLRPLGMGDAGEGIGGGGVGRRDFSLTPHCPLSPSCRPLATNSRFAACRGLAPAGPRPSLTAPPPYTPPRPLHPSPTPLHTPPTPP